ncbi:hypothetical protein MNBD_UNCLBAC01-833 [hydrothermal vent metagenome]|uniref:Alginate export domain-containing protein n=1 Tax=hydrothermal vent metagenome TaxID=652676 RepID=A0A3B1CZX7_9ZZZZ
MKKIFLFIIATYALLNSLLLSPVQALIDLGFETSGEILIRAYQDIKDEAPFQDNQAIDSRFYWFNEFNLKDQNLKFVFGLDARGELFRNQVTVSNSDLYLREAYVDFKQDNYNIRIGNQKVTWGKLDDFTVLDRMTPQDFRWFALFEKQERKLPTLAIKHTYYADNWQFEGIFLPFFDPSEINFFGSDWAVFGHLKDEIANGSFSGSAKNNVQRISIIDKDNLTDNNLKNSQVGLKFKSRVGEVDYDFYYMYTYSPLPVLREKTSAGNTVKQFLYDPTAVNLEALVDIGATDTDLTLEREHSRMHVIGADWETVLGDYGVRGEAGMFLNSPYLRENMSYVTKNTFTIGAGIDHTTAKNLYFNFQLVLDYIFDYENLFAQKAFSQQLTGTLTQDFLRDTIALNFDWAWSPSYRDWMLNPEIQYKFKNGLHASLGSYIFEGKSSTILGRYSNKDLLYMELSFSF